MPSNTPEYSRTHHEMNKKLFIICECGKRVSKPNLCSHLTTKWHTEFLFIKNGGVVEPIEEDIKVNCIHCGFSVFQSKMDLHLISVKCKKSREATEAEREVTCILCGHMVCNSKLEAHKKSLPCRTFVNTIKSYQNNDIDDLELNVLNMMSMSSFGKLYNDL